MRKTLPLILVLSFAACLVQAQSLRSKINKVDRAVTQKLKAKDSAGFEAVLKNNVTDDFQYVENGQSESFDSMCKTMATSLGMMKRITTCNAHLMTLHQKGNTATGTSFHEMKGTMMGPDKKMHKMAFTGTTRDTYVKDHGAWKMSKMEWVKQTSMMDGKPMKGM